jgi:hypothetical protein
LVSGNFSANWSMIGHSILHGPHREARKSITDSPLCSKISVLNCSLLSMCKVICTLLINKRT